MISNTALYTDTSIVIKHIDDRFQCEWISKEPINHSYMSAKLTELIGNKFPGAWPVKDIEEAKTSRGLRCFITEWKGDILIARWI